MAPWAESCQLAQRAATKTRPTSKLATFLRKLSQGEPFSEKNVSSFPHYFHRPYFYGSPFSTVFISESYKTAPKLGHCQKWAIHIHSCSCTHLCSHKMEHVSDELIYFLNVWQGKIESVQEIMAEALE